LLRRLLSLLPGTKLGAQSRFFSQYIRIFSTLKGPHGLFAKNFSGLPEFFK